MGDQSRSFAAKGIPRENLGPRVDTIRSFLGEDTFLQVYGRLGIHEGVVPAEHARKNLIPHLLDRFRDSVLGSKG